MLWPGPRPCWPAHACAVAARQASAASPNHLSTQTRPPLCVFPPCSYNTIISACAKAGQPAAAAGVYERMLVSPVID